MKARPMIEANLRPARKPRAAQRRAPVVREQARAAVTLAIKVAADRYVHWHALKAEIAGAVEELSRALEVLDRSH